MQLHHGSPLVKRYAHHTGRIRNQSETCAGRMVSLTSLTTETSAGLVLSGDDGRVEMGFTYTSRADVDNHALDSCFSRMVVPPAWSGTSHDTTLQPSDSGSTRHESGCVPPFRRYERPRRLGR
jgi:hypothetical protein